MRNALSNDYLLGGAVVPQLANEVRVLQGSIGLCDKPAIGTSGHNAATPWDACIVFESARCTRNRAARRNGRRRMECPSVHRDKAACGE
jgi:hypothetical protein